VLRDLLLVEIKAVERLLPVHQAQLLAYLKLTQLPAALLVNFNAVTLLVLGSPWAHVALGAGLTGAHRQARLVR
jgi:hypothetical protein